LRFNSTFLGEEKMNQITILIVEDDNSIIELLKNILLLTFNDGEGLEILEAETVRKAENLFISNNQEIKLILMDGCLNSATPNTLELVRKIKKVSPELPIIAMSGSSKFNQRLRNSGCDEQMEKPLDVNNMMSLVKKLIFKL